MKYIDRYNLRYPKVEQYPEVEKEFEPVEDTYMYSPTFYQDAQEG